MDYSKLLPFKTLTSERLFLRKINENDKEVVFALRSNPKTMKYIPRPIMKNVEDALGHIKMIQDKIESSEGINWAITLKEDFKMIGIIGHYKVKWENFRSEIGYIILPEHEGKGIITEAIGLIIDYGFNVIKMHSLEAIIDPQNHASARVLEKNGFIKEAHIKENTFFEGKFYDSVIYSLITQ